MCVPSCHSRADSHRTASSLCSKSGTPASLAPSPPPSAYSRGWGGGGELCLGAPACPNGIQCHLTCQLALPSFLEAPWLQTHDCLCSAGTQVWPAWGSGLHPVQWVPCCVLVGLPPRMCLLGKRVCISLPTPCLPGRRWQSGDQRGRPETLVSCSWGRGHYLGALRSCAYVYTLVHSLFGGIKPRIPCPQYPSSGLVPGVLQRAQPRPGCCGGLVAVGPPHTVPGLSHSSSPWPGPL